MKGCDDLLVEAPAQNECAISVYPVLSTVHIVLHSFAAIDWHHRVLGLVGYLLPHPKHLAWVG